MDWERQQIELIKDKMLKYFERTGFGIQEIVENNRDGGYILYSNKNESVKVLIQFLPSYDIIIKYSSSPFIAFIKFLTNKNKENHILSIKNELKMEKIKDFASFLIKR